MRLLTKVTILYLLITLVVFAAGGVMAYYLMMDEIEAEHQRFLRRRLNRTAEMIEMGEKIHNYEGEKMKVVALGPEGEETHFRSSDTLVWHPYLERQELHYKVSAVKKIGDEYYYMETYDVIVEADDITQAVVTSLSRIFLLLLVAFGGIAVFFSARIFRPFNQTLDRIRTFRVRDREPLVLPETGTREFARLNHFIEQMAEKSRREYQALKEFSENASHEIQTPLAIARSKLELLLESPNLSDQEMGLVGSAQESINKLSKLSRSLSLLTKIENEEFGDAELVDFSRLVERAIDQFSELAELKALTLRHHIEPGVAIRIDPVLADVLLTNLLQNAVRHNYEGGCIEVRLDPGELRIQNTGQPPQVPPEEFFRRFRKNQQSGESLGLGLAIVKRICELNQLGISYRYFDERHQVRIGLHDEYRRCF